MWQLVHIVILAFHRLLSEINHLSIHLAIILLSIYHQFTDLDSIHFYPGHKGKRSITLMRKVKNKQKQAILNTFEMHSQFLIKPSKLQKSEGMAY